MPETLRATTSTDVVAEATGRGAATLTRLGYLAERFGRHDIVEALRPLLPEQLPVTFLGPRQPRGHWVRHWKLYGSVEPRRWLAAVRDRYAFVVELDEVEARAARCNPADRWEVQQLTDALST